MLESELKLLLSEIPLEEFQKKIVHLISQKGISSEISALVLNENQTISDFIIIANCFSEDLRSRLFKRGVIGQYLLIFAIRHRLTQILEDNNYKKCGKLDNLRLQLSSLGLHISAHGPKLCSHFDPYDNKYCWKEVSENHYCQEHSSEAWWLAHHASHESSVFAKTCYFYSKTEHITEFTPEKLEYEIGNFWNQYLNFHKNKVTQEELQSSLETMGYAKGTSLDSLSRSEVRKLFLEKAQTHHPDKGGNKEDFQILKESYENILKAMP